jgi:hypothetical protein
VTGTLCLEDLDLRLMIRQARDQSVRTLKSVKVGCAENHFPRELQLEFLQPIVEAMLSESLVHDRA